MTAHVGEDFGDFVAARWPDLEAVALVATLDPQAARELTADTLAALRSRWRETLEDGAPTAAARRDLLARVDRWNRGRGGPAAVAAPDPSVRAAVEDDTSALPAALVDTLAAEPAVVRAGVAATVLWDLPGDDIGPLLGRSAALPGIRDARSHLLDAHRRARLADGLDPADHRLDDDLADTLHRLARVHTGPPDPDDLVRRRTARVRRRHLVVGAAGLAVAAGAAGTLALRDRDPGAATRTASPSSPAVPPGTDPSWARTATWAPRGDLRTDPRIPAVLVDPEGSAAQLVYAGEMHGRRIVVASEGTVALAGELRVWTGPAGTPPEQLAPVQLALPGIYDDVALVAVGVPHPAGALVLVLARPTVPAAQLSFTVRPRPDGRIDRTWRPLALDAGIGSLLLAGPPGLASRLRCDGYDGPLPRPGRWDAARLGGDGEEAVDEGRDDTLRSDVAVATGVPGDRLETRTTSYTLPGVVSIFGGSIIGRVTIRLQQVRTPDGAVVRSSYIEATSADGSVTGYGDPAMVIPADAAEAPYVTQVDDDPSGRGTYAVLTDRAAASVRLYGGTGPDDLLGPPAKVRRGAAVVRSGVARGVARLVVRAADGTVLYDAPPVRGRWLFDLYDLEDRGV